MYEPSLKGLPIAFDERLLSRVRVGVLYECEAFGSTCLLVKRDVYLVT